MGRAGAPRPVTLRPRPAPTVAGRAAVDHCDERVESLAQFQQAAVLHALRFPALQRLVYSTCRHVCMLGTLPWPSAPSRPCFATPSCLLRARPHVPCLA